MTTLTKGKVESGVKYFKGNFLPGRTFVDDHDLLEQMRQWEREGKPTSRAMRGESPPFLPPSAPVAPVKATSVRPPPAPEFGLSPADRSWSRRHSAH